MAMESPPADGFFGPYGGCYIPETLVPAVEELAEAYRRAMADAGFQAELASLLREYVGRPTPLYRATRLGEAAGVPKLYLKREDLCHTGAHKINNAVAQALLASRMGKRRLVAETGAGQHGVATAAAAARFGLSCVVYMGEVDMARQEPNVRRMRLMGAEVRAVLAGQRTLKEAVSEAIRDWIATSSHTHYVLGSALGPHPYPSMVRDFQSVIGREARAQVMDAEGRLPGLLVACVGGGSNSIGFFHPFLQDAGVRMVGVEAGGHGDAIGQHAARFHGGRPGVLQGTRSYVLQDDEGQIALTASVSAGLDYAAIGPEHAFLRDCGRVQYGKASDAEALGAFQALNRLEGILPALESSHAVAWVLKNGRSLPPDEPVLVCLSGRGDKDMAHALRHIEADG